MNHRRLPVRKRNDPRGGTAISWAHTGRQVPLDDFGKVITGIEMKLWRFLVGVLLFGGSAFAQVADRPIHFEDYKVPASTVHYPARLQVTDAKSRQFVTMLRQAARKRPNFAGHFVLASWGCGASCIMIAAIDRRSGQVFWLPFTLCCWKVDIAKPLEFRTGSSLLVLHGSRDESGDGTYYYNFANHTFMLIRPYEADKH